MTRVQSQWSVLYICGHCPEHDLTEITPRDRESRACWLATRVCTKCWKSLTPEPTFGLGLAPAVTVTWTQVRPVPLLVGTPKQVTWATSLRVTLLTRLLAHHVIVGMDLYEFVRRVDLPAKVFRDASIWIDHREVGLGDLEKVLHGVIDGHPNAAVVSSDFATKLDHESDNNQCNYLDGGLNR
jgi:hypothetical protein